MKISTIGTQKESQILEKIPAINNSILHYDLEYDFTKPEKTIREFVADIKAMVSRYEFNKNRVIEIENELNDICHYMEISSYKNVPEGYRLYRKLAELRRERRACKNENDLLQPVYQYFHATEVLNKLTTVQGEVAKAKSAIDARTYLVRTNALDEWLNPPKKEEEAPEPVPDIFELAAEVKPNDDGTETTLIHLDEKMTDLINGKAEDIPQKNMAKWKQVWKAAN